jgi:exonuclease III
MPDLPSLSILSLNISKGARSKMGKIIEFALANSIDILALQETHSFDATSPLPHNCPFVTFASPSSHGVAFLVHQSVSPFIHSFSPLSEGRSILIHLVFGSHSFSICNLYLPTCNDTRSCL